METPTIQSISQRYKPLKDIPKYRDVCGIYSREDKVIGYYMIYLMATKLNGLIRIFRKLNNRPQ
jgi:hypothetical protein